MKLIKERQETYQQSHPYEGHWNNLILIMLPTFSDFSMNVINNKIAVKPMRQISLDLLCENYHVGYQFGSKNIEKIPYSLCSKPTYY